MTVPEININEFSESLNDKADRDLNNLSSAGESHFQAPIADLSTIRSGASTGATAVQPASLASVATSGSYSDLSNKPTIPTVYDATLTIQKNGTTIKTFTANASSDVTCNITVPTQASDISAEPAISLTASRAVVSNSSGKLTTSSVTSTELGYVSGVTSAIQTQINAKQDALVSGTNIKTVNNTNLLGSGNINISTTVATDGSSITTNQSDEIQTVGVINSRDSSMAIKVWTGTRSQYDALVSGNQIDANTLYNITDDTDINLSLLDALYPVGSIYMTINDTCPLATLGIGTWTKVASGVVTSLKSTAPVKGNGLTIGLTDGSSNSGMYAINNYLTAHTGVYGKNTGVTPSSGSFVTGKTIGLTTTGSNSGVIADLSSVSNTLTCNFFRRTA